MTHNWTHRGKLFQRAIVLAAAPPLVYCAGLLYGLEGRVPYAGPWLLFVALAGALLTAGLHTMSSRRAAAVADAAELVLRYALALLLIQYALNKLIPGQFLLYNRDLDLPVRELADRRLAWHFLGHSRLYNGFIAVIELAAGLLLCSRRTAAGGVLLGLAALVNVVAIDLAFGLRGALPIATVMASAALALAIVHVDWRMLRSLAWQSRDVGSPHRSLATRAVWVLALAFVIGFPLYMNVAARRGLGGQVPATGRWEVLECTPNPRIAPCPLPDQPAPAVMYLEIGQWGQLVAGSRRRGLSFRYDKARGLLTVRIAPSAAAIEPEVVISGAVRETDTIVVLDGRAEGVPPFQVRVKRTHRAPWPPVRAF